VIISAIVFDVVCRFDSSEPGCVFLKETSVSAETKHILLKSPDSLPPARLPSPIPPPGLSRDRQKYLYKNISEFCRADVRDITCPPPDDDPEVETDREEGCSYAGYEAPQPPMQQKPKVATKRKHT